MIILILKDRSACIMPLHLEMVTTAPIHPNTTIGNSVRAASKASGYRLIIEGGSMATSITTGTAFPITLNWKNVGLSPTYENWDIVFELKNSGGTTVWSGKSAFQLRLFLPQTNATARTDNFTVPTSVAAGTYSLILYVKDPANYRHHFHWQSREEGLMGVMY